MKYYYKNELITLYSLFEFSKNLNIKLIVPDDAEWNVRNIMLIFRQAIDSVGVILSSLPESPIESQFKTFTPTIAASQGRILIDHYLSIAYLSSAHDQEMLEFQEMVWNQAIDFKRWQVVSTFNKDNEHLPDLEEKIKDQEEQIRIHPFFLKLDKNLRNNCAKGFKDKIFNRNDIRGKIKIVPKIFWTLDTHFSQYVHSTAYSTDQLAIFGNDINESLSFLKHFISNICGLFSLIILETCIVSGFNEKQIPLGIFGTLIFWREFFEGKDEGT